MGLKLADHHTELRGLILVREVAASLGRQVACYVNALCNIHVSKAD
jgi:hypothetical protein